MDSKTKQLVNIAIQTANRNLGSCDALHYGKKCRMQQRRNFGAVIINVHLSGLATILECLQAAIKGLKSIK